jgi:hypothetical protein
MSARLLPLRQLRQLLAMLALLLAWQLPAHAHKASDSYLSLNVDAARIDGQWDIALRDLEMAIGLDANGDAAITWDEVRARHADIAAYALARLALTSAGQACPLRVTGHLIDTHTDGAYAVLRLAGACPEPVSTLGVDYALLFDIDPQHKGLLRLTHGATTRSAIFAPDARSQQLEVARAAPWRQFADYVRHGTWHIWIGFDHILFLVSLLLPAVLVREGGQWQARSTWRSALFEVLKIVTAFTLAHSLTLSLAALGVVSLPSRLVESLIAASVILAALNNLWPLVQRWRALAAFGFGLLHGFGFASVLADLGLPQHALVLSLVGFNVGVELGQLAIVGVLLPLAYLLRRGSFYQRVVMTGGSLAIAAIALVWLAERAFDLKLLA